MKRNSVLISFILFTQIVFPQANFSWYPVRPGIQNNYRIDSSSAQISDVIKIDSVSGTSPVYYLNKIIIHCDTCKNNLLLNDPTDSVYILNNQAQFLKRSFVKLPDNSFYFKNPSSLLLCPFLPAGSTWLCDTAKNISASLVLKTIQPVLGVNDSVCIIQLSTNDTIILSRNFGLVQFPYKTLAQHNYQLVGIEGVSNAGVKLKRFHDFFNFSSGDVFQYSFTDSDYNIFPPKFMEGHERWNIQSAAIYNDSVCCSIKKVYFDSVWYGGNPATLTSYTANINITFIDSAAHMGNTYPLQEISVTPYFIYNNGIKYIHKIVAGVGPNLRQLKSFGENCPNIILSKGMTGAAQSTPFANVYQAKSGRIIGRTLTEGLGFTSELYNDYDRIYERCLIGYIKGTETYGTVYDEPLMIKKNQVNSLHLVFADPANDLLIIQGSAKCETRFSLITALGQIVIQQQFQDTEERHIISTSSLSPGVYLAVLEDKHSTEIKKVIIQAK